MITALETQRSLAEYVRQETVAATNDAQQFADTLTARQLEWSPGKNEWSIAQVFEHLCVSHDSYLNTIEREVATQKAPRLADIERGNVAPDVDPLRDAVWTPRFAGSVLVRSLRSARKLAAPRLFRVGKVRERVIDEFIAREWRIVALLDRAAPLHWAECRFGSPVSTVIRLNLGDCFLVLAEHAKRHLQQVARITALPDFAMA